MSEVVRKVSEKTGREYNDSNLVKITKETASDNGKKGGVKSGEARRKRKTLKENLLLLLGEGETQNNITLALIDKAMSGDVKAYETIRDTIGEKPVDKVDSKVDANVEGQASITITYQDPNGEK